MIRSKLLVLLSLLFILLGNDIVAQQKIPKKNIEKFFLTAYTKTSKIGDSLEVLIFMQIPYFSLQFVKVDTQFIAHYEAVIALQGKKGRQIGREVWQDSVIVDNYTQTNSITDNQMLMVSFNIPSGKYNIVGSLSDLDTKNSGENSIKLNIVDYEMEQYLHPPILLDKSGNDWGFGNNLIPAYRNSSFEIDDGLNIFLSGKVIPGKYDINTQFIAKGGKVLWESVTTDTSETGIFEQIVNLPKEYIEGITIKVITKLDQGKFTTEKESKIIIRKVGISHLISDISDALEQMRYILDSQERAKVKKTAMKNREKLFKKLWQRRDPSPDSDINELMNEYYKRVAYSNFHFDSYVDGWETDMGMIYIIFGAPDDIERTILPQMQNSAEVWHYYRIQKSFSFIDSDGFGHYQLTTPYLGYRR